MIARPLPLPEEPPVPRIGSRSGRNAVVRRRALRRRTRYLLLARIVVTVSVATVFIGVYLALMANVTRMNYELSKNQRRQAALTEESARLDDQIEQLGARERLAVLGAKLGMHESESFAQVSLPIVERATSKTTGIAFLPWLK